MHILEKKIREAVEAGRTALVPFVTAGYPEKERFWNVLEELDDSGAGKSLGGGGHDEFPAP